MKAPTAVVLALALLAGVDGAGTSLYAACGDGSLDPGESCDDGNVAPGDGCSTACRIEVTGHFKCYRAAITHGTPGFSPLQTTLVDRFETKTVMARKPVGFCTPVGGVGPVPDPRRHLTCYEVRDLAGQPQSSSHATLVHDQFGDHSFVVRKPRTVCLPSLGGTAARLPLVLEAPNDPEEFGYTVATIPE